MMKRRDSATTTWPHQESSSSSSSSSSSTLAAPLLKSNEIADKTIVFKNKENPEIVTSSHGTIKDRLARLKTEQGTMLRKKHVPEHLQDALLDKTLKDTTRGQNVGFEYNFHQAGKKMDLSKGEKGHTMAHHESNQSYDKIYETEIKKPKQEPEILTGSWAGQTMRRKHNEPFTFEERMARLKSEQGTMLRLKHAPQRHHQFLKNKTFKDTTRGHDVGFEFNFKHNGNPLPETRGRPCDAHHISSMEYDVVYEKTKMRPKSPEIEEEHHGNISTRQASIRVQQGTNLRKSKHVPDRLKNQDLVDHPKVRTVGFEYNVTGKPGRVN
jgi:hypothetical protein